MSKISTKKDYQDGQVLYGIDLNANNDVIEQGVNDNYELIMGLKTDKTDKTEFDESIQDINDSITNLEANKVNKEDGKGLSTNDFTDTYKTKLDSLENYDDTSIKADLDSKADKTEIPTKTSQLENDSGFITSDDIPTIPTKTSQLENDSNFASETYVNTQINSATSDVMTETEYVDTDGKIKEDKLPDMSYELPIASSETLGGIKVGDGLEIDPLTGILKSLGGSGSGIETLEGTYENPVDVDNLKDDSIYFIKGYTKYKMAGNSNYSVQQRDMLCITMNTPNNPSPSKLQIWISNSGNNYAVYQSRVYRPTFSDWSSPVNQSIAGIMSSITSTINENLKGLIPPSMKFIDQTLGRKPLTDLATTNKTSLVDAINEVNEKAGTGGGGSYELPIASSETLGGIKVGEGLDMDPLTGILKVVSDTTNDIPTLKVPSIEFDRNIYPFNGLASLYGKTCSYILIEDVDENPRIALYFGTLSGTKQYQNVLYERNGEFYITNRYANSESSFTNADWYTRRFSSSKTDRSGNVVPTWQGVFERIGNKSLSALATTNKTSIVDAINEVNTKASSGTTITINRW